MDKLYQVRHRLSENLSATQFLWFDEEWNETDYEHRLITYTNLPGGEYTFLVRAAKQPGTWTEPIEMKIKVVPPFYKTTWFIIFAILAMSGIVFLIISLRTRLINKQKQRLENEVNKRTQEVKQQNVLITQRNDELEKHIEFALETGYDLYQKRGWVWTLPLVSGYQLLAGNIFSLVASSQ